MNIAMLSALGSFAQSTKDAVIKEIKAIKEKQMNMILSPDMSMSHNGIRRIGSQWRAY